MISNKNRQIYTYTIRKLPIVGTHVLFSLKISTLISLSLLCHHRIRRFQVVSDLLFFFPLFKNCKKTFFQNYKKQKDILCYICVCIEQSKSWFRSSWFLCRCLSRRKIKDVWCVNKVFVQKRFVQRRIHFIHQNFCRFNSRVW